MGAAAQQQVNNIYFLHLECASSLHLSSKSLSPAVSGARPYAVVCNCVNNGVKGMADGGEQADKGSMITMESVLIETRINNCQRHDA
jgi:hypothetical protein